MKTKHSEFKKVLVLLLLCLPVMVSAQDEAQDVDDPFAIEGVEEETDEQPVVRNEVSAGLYYLDDDSYRYGKYTGLTDDGASVLLDFRIEKRPQYDSEDVVRWRIQGWRLGLDSRRLEFNYKDQGTQSFTADYREIPNYRFSDGLTPYQGVGGTDLALAPTWKVAPGSSNTTGFLALDESLSNLSIDSKRRRMDLSYVRELGKSWDMTVDYRHETKKGERTIGSIFGYTGGNPRSVILPAPVDYTTDIIETMFNYNTSRAQFGFGFYASFFNNDDASLAWQNAYGRQAQWAPSVSYPDAQGRLALEPDNSYLQFKAYGGLNLAAGTRLTADVSFGQMEQDDALLPYSINPQLLVHTPVPLDSLNAQIDTTMLNLRFTSQLARRLGLALNYHFDDRDNKTPRAVYPYIGADSQDQRPAIDGRINLPYSYTKQKADAIATYRLSAGTRLKGGLEYSDYSREYSEVSDADEFAWLAGVKFGVFETAAINFDYRNSSRDVTAYIGNVPLIESHIPGTVDEDEWENHPLLRKYFLTDRDRQEYRLRTDFFPVPEVNFGFAASYFEDDYGDGFYGLNKADVTALTVDFGWYPVEHISLVTYYTNEKYDASQSSISFNNPAAAANPNGNWFVDTEDDVDTYNISLAFTEIGEERGWNHFEMGFDYTYSDTNSQRDVTAVTLTTAPLPALISKLRSVSAWALLDVGERSSIRLSIENSKLSTDDFGLDNVVPNTLANVLTLGESAANYDILLVSGAWIFHF